MLAKKAKISVLLREMGAQLSKLNYLLSPFAWLYGSIMRLRNYCYDTGIFQVYDAPVPVICVGNLSVGGTGKTPQVEYLARQLQDKRLAILSRGYKRSTKGFVLADAAATPETLGDEPFQYTQNLPQAKVAVCEKRAVGIQQLLRLFPDLELILLDDAFQHRAVKASFYLLLTDYSRLFTQDLVLPAGRLREPRSGARRAQAVMVTKCPTTISQEERTHVENQISYYTTPGTPVFFSCIVYGAAVPFGAQTTLAKKLVLVTGIANPQPLVQHLQAEGFTIVQHFVWADHAAVTSEKVGEVIQFWEKLATPDISILMTQKDAVKWRQPHLEILWQKAPVYYLPVCNAFAPQEPSFDDTIRQGIAGPQSGFNS